MRIVTRFAPSPTGMLHIGGVRTALFNWLYAKRHGGAFLLRIEDTDRARSTPEAVKAIIDGLEWAGLSSEAIVFQSERTAIHQAAVQTLLDKNAAFICHMDEQEENHARAQARAEGRALRSPWRNRLGDPSRPHRIRMRAPDSGQLSIADLVQGEVSIAASDIDDLVLMRTDGSPTYMLASVVDDHEMQVTHIIRGDDHLINAIRQTPIRRALGGHEPVFAHVPLIHGADGKKLSKRHGAVGIEEYAQAGFLPPGLKNYLLLLGWSAGNREFLTDADMQALFDLDGLGKSPARLDPVKLAHIHKLHMAKTPDSVLLRALCERSSFADQPRPIMQRIEAAIEHLKTRASTVEDLEQECAFLTLSRPIHIPPKLAKKLDTTRRAYLTQLAACLTDLDTWTPNALGGAMEAFCDRENLSFGQVGPGLRACLTGGKKAPGLEWVMHWLGREETLARIADV